MPLICAKSVDFKLRLPHSNGKTCLEAVLLWKLFQGSYAINVYMVGATTIGRLYSDTFARVTSSLDVCSRFWTHDQKYSVDLLALIFLSILTHDTYKVSFTPKYVTINIMYLFENNWIHYLYTIEGKKIMLVLKLLTDIIIYNKLQ